MTTAAGHGEAEGQRPRHVHPCIFPSCEEAATTSAGMCEQHRQVAVSGTGSWLETG